MSEAEPEKSLETEGSLETEPEGVSEPLFVEVSLHLVSPCWERDKSFII